MSTVDETCRWLGDVVEHGLMPGWIPTSVGLLALPLALASCVVESVCYNDADCPDTHLCDRPPPPAKNGQCRKRCASTTDCINPSRTCDSRPWISGAVCLQRCADDAACPTGSLCDVVLGSCFAGECREDSQCTAGFECRGGFCFSSEPLRCPADMVAVENRFCVDVYEASRADATASFVGNDNSRATSRPGALPWVIPDNAAALAACVAAGKTLCTESQWQQACAGPAGTVYGYGDTYSATACNGIDKYCRCHSGPCDGASPCPYAHCYNSCGTSRGLMTDPTGDNPECTNGYGVFDMNGNLWEHVLGGDDTRVRGGAYNCLNSESLHRCAYIPGTWAPSARGFRCCGTGEVSPADGAAADGASPDGVGDP